MNNNIDNNQNQPSDAKWEYSDHYPVMLNEMLENLMIREGGKYLDCTFGAGGYSRAILSSANCYVTSLDQDPNVKSFADQLQKEYQNKFKFIQTNFADSFAHLKGQEFDGIVLDLGVSSMQLDQGARGFSFQKDGLLDMRMSGAGFSAADFINEASEKEIGEIIRDYGDEPQYRRIAKKIIEVRKDAPITTTLQLADIIRSVKAKGKSKIDPATKTFQAIRIHVNQELESIKRFLVGVKSLLKVEGRLVVVSFHSLEDVLIKNFIKDNALKKVAKSKYSSQPDEIQPGKWLKNLTKKPIEPSEQEININIRSRSAKMRVAERVGGHDVK